jgi:hypothetical protein
MTRRPPDPFVRALLDSARRDAPASGARARAHSRLQGATHPRSGLRGAVALAAGVLVALLSMRSAPSALSALPECTGGLESASRACATHEVIEGGRAAPTGSSSGVATRSGGGWGGGG